MKILSWNVNGLRAIVKKGFNKWLDENAPDILCIQETKTYPEQVEEFSATWAGYKRYWNNPEKKGYAGVSVFTKEEPVAVSTDFGPEGFDTEGRVLELDMGGFVLINGYFPNGRMNASRLDYKMEFYRHFLEHLGGFTGRKVVICGDLNTAHKEIDLARPKANENYSGFLPIEREWMDKLVEAGYVDIFRSYNDQPGQYTWWDYKSRARDRNVGWRIDYFFVSGAMVPHVKDAFLMPEVDGSDHCPVGMEIERIR
ncbi:MAG: exodeoxyribonuclease III [Candidatus Omnitrophica bacterium]|nr:exodeoxyribonuclease III [Candidatus Omnitrophota bacterium]MDD5487507.1 exodeoxyribonuclease III [Candidatus Omnitrophota bacterium]